MKQFLKIFERLNWPQAVVLLGIVAGIVCALIWASPAVVARIPWQVLLGAGAASTLGIAGAFTGHLIHRNPDRRERSSDPPEAP